MCLEPSPHPAAYAFPFARPAAGTDCIDHPPQGRPPQLSRWSTSLSRSMYDTRAVPYRETHGGRPVRLVPFQRAHSSARTARRTWETASPCCRGRHARCAGIHRRSPPGRRPPAPKTCRRAPSDKAMGNREQGTGNGERANGLAFHSPVLNSLFSVPGSPFLPRWFRLGQVRTARGDSTHLHTHIRYGQMRMRL
jgi:hypothetical protein